MKKLLLITMICFLTVSVFAGNKSKSGAAGAQQLNMPVGARMIALSGAALSTVSGIEALYWNPAGVSGITGNSEISIFNGENIGGIDQSYFAAGFNFGDVGVFSFALKSLDFGDIIRTTEIQTDGTGETFSPSFMTTTVGYSNSLTDRIRVGISVNIVSEKIIRTSATGVAFDAGIQYSNLANINGLSFGVVLKNLGPAMKYEGPDMLRVSDDGSRRGPQWMKIDAAPFELPSMFQIGVGYAFSIDDMNALHIGGTFENNNYSYDTYRGSLEYSFNEMLYLRGSYLSTPDGLDTAYNLWGASFGAGINYDLGYFKVNVDYAYRDSQYFGGLNQFGVTFGL